MRDGWPRVVPIVTGALVVVLAVVAMTGLTLWRLGAPAPGADADAPRPAPAEPPAEDAPGTPPTAPAARGPASEGTSETLPARDQEALELPRGGWASVDLGAARAALPDNLFWKMGAPTKDPEVLRSREEERARWNVEYGKVLSSTATAEEVNAYYAHRQRLSEDYAAFAAYLLLHYRDALDKQDLGLLKLSMDMHLARLEEIPGQIAEAHQRREAHDAARRAWLAEQKAFEGDPPPR